MVNISKFNFITGQSWGSGSTLPYAAAGQYRVHPYGRFASQTTWGQSHQY